MGNPNFTRAGGRRALDRADLRADRAARIARIAAGDAAIDDFARNGVALILPAAGLNRNLLGAGLRNHGRAGNLTLNVFVDDAVDRIGAGLLFGGRNHDRVVDLLRNLSADDAVDRVGAGLLFGDRNHDRVRNFLLTLFVNNAVDRIGAGLLLGNRNHDRVVHLLRNLGPNGAVDGVGAGLLFSDRNHDRVRNLLLNVFPNDAVDRAVDGLLAVFPNHTVDGVGNLTRLTFRDVLREDALTGNRNALNLSTVASNLLVFADDLAAGLHDDVALSREFRRARAAAGVRTRAAISSLSLIRAKRYDGCSN